MSEATRRKVAALLRMTPEAGCTEAEAVTAAAKAAELMREHGLTAAEVPTSESRARARSRGGSPRDGLWSALGRCTNTVAFLDGFEMVFVGPAPGPEIAAYLHVVLNRAVDRAVTEFKAGRFYRSRRSFSANVILDEFALGVNHEDRYAQTPVGGPFLLDSEGSTVTVGKPLGGLGKIALRARAGRGWR